jgi:single-stranded-DNA-specific exonuclease
VLSKFGGHAMAAGMSLDKQPYAVFVKAFDAEVRRLIKADDLQAIAHSDGELSGSELTLGLAQLLRGGGPWG